MTELASKHLGERFAPQLPGGFEQVISTIQRASAAAAVYDVQCFTVLPQSLL
jgi:hypothetical protein